MCVPCEGENHPGGRYYRPNDRASSVPKPLDTRSINVPARAMSPLAIMEEAAPVLARVDPEGRYYRPDAADDWQMLAPQDIGDFRARQAELAEFLDAQKVQKKAQEGRARPKSAATATYYKEKPKPDWLIWKGPPDFFEEPIVDSEPSRRYIKDWFQSGFWQQLDKKPPHHQPNVKGVWDPFAKQEAGRAMVVLDMPGFEEQIKEAEKLKSIKAAVSDAMWPMTKDGIPESTWIKLAALQIGFYLPEAWEKHKVQWNEKVNELVEALCKSLPKDKKQIAMWKAEIHIGQAKLSEFSRVPPLAAGHPKVSEFGHVPLHRCTEKELRYAQVAASNHHAGKKIESAEAIRKTCSRMRREDIHTNAHPTSVLKGEKPPWVLQAVATHEVFMDAPPACPTGVDRHVDDVVRKHVVECARAHAHDSQIITGKTTSSSKWKGRQRGTLLGTRRRAEEAEALLRREFPDNSGAKLRQRQRPQSAPVCNRASSTPQLGAGADAGLQAGSECAGQAGGSSKKFAEVASAVADSQPARPRSAANVGSVQARVSLHSAGLQRPQSACAVGAVRAAIADKRPISAVRRPNSAVRPSSAASFELLRPLSAGLRT